MRSLLILAAALFSATPALAQVTVVVSPVSAQRGQIELSGSAAFTSSDGNSSITISPSIGYFVTNSVQAGLETIYVNISGADGNGSLGPFVAYHFGTPVDRVRPFVQAQAGIGLSSDASFGVTGSAGVKYFFLPGGALRGQAFLSTGNETTFGALCGVSIFF